MAVLDGRSDDRAGSSGADGVRSHPRPGPASGEALSPALVGRAEELARLVSVVAAPPSVVLVEGEAGIGKTRLVTELRMRPESVGRRFLIGGARAISEPFPLGPLLEAVRGAGDRFAPGVLSPVAGALRPLLPELADVLPELPEPLDDRAAERHRVFRGLRELVAGLCPATVVLEDLHWADQQTVEFLQDLLGDPPAGLSLVVTFRGEEVDSRLRAVGARLPAAVGRAQVTLAPLDVSQTGELAAAIMATDRVSAEFAGYLCARTGGLPFAVEEVVALLRERGEVSRMRGRWWRPALDELAVPTAVRDHVLARAELMPAGARRLMDILAVLHDPASEQLIAGVAGGPGGAVAAELAPAIRAGLLVDHDGAVGFRHALAAQAVYDEIPGPERRSLHERAAATLREHDPARLGRIAHHLRHAGQLAQWAVAAEQAADRAVALGHDDEVAWLLEGVLRQTSVADDVAARLAVKLGRAAMAMLRPPGVADVLWGVLGRSLPGSVRAELQMLLGAMLDHVDSGSSASRDLFRDAVGNAGHRTDLKAWALVAGVMRGPPEATYQQQRQALSQALELLPTLADRDFETFLLGKIGLVLTLLGDSRWRELTARIEAQAGTVPRRRRHVNAYESVGGSAVFVGHYQAAGRLLTAALEGALCCEDRKLEAYVRSGLVMLDYCRGRWQELPAAVAGLTEQLTEHARTRYRLDVVAGNLALARGEVERAEQLLSSVMSSIEDGEGSDMLPMVVGSLVRLAVGRGEAETAVSVVDHYLAVQASLPLWPASFRCLPQLVKALVAAPDRTAQAHALVSRFAGELAGRDTPLAPAALEHARGFLAAADDPARAAGWFRTAADRYELLQCHYEAAQAREQAAQALAAAGDAAAVEPPLRAAMAAYEQLGATWDLARAARAARQQKVSVPARHRGGHRGYGDELSPREREVADLLVTGRTNQEVAAELFVTPETVKKHVQAVMRKLGVRSRSALAHQLLRQHRPSGDG